MAKSVLKPNSSIQLGSDYSWMHRLAYALIALIQFVCPLLFFTNLTRNPYFTQIALLYLLLALLGLVWMVRVWRSGEWVLPRFGVEKSIGIFLLVALGSLLFSWIQHPSLRSGIVYEGMRVWIFTLVNSALVLYLPVLFVKPLKEETKLISIWPDLIFAWIWGMLWLGFHSMRITDPRVLIWDPYGAILWGTGLIYILYRTRLGDMRAFVHVIFIVTVLAGLYGVMQYAGRDLIWSSPVTPYGGRPVSTFGNPNFLSSYLLLVGPLAVAFALTAKKSEAVGYWIVAGIAAVSVLCTLTRSTYVGLFAAFLGLAFFLYRREHQPLVLKIIGATAVIALLIVVFPGSPVSKIQSPLARFTEVFDAMKTGESYGPWHQRILIWSSAWDMVRERPLFGKGWGCFELFYPFYQGAYLFVPVFAMWRTHANNAHNVVMEIWSQVGTLGMGAGILLFGVLVVGGFKVVQTKVEDSGRIIAAGLFSGWIGMVVDNFFGNVSIFFAMPAFLFWWNMGSLFNEASALTALRRSSRSVFSRAVLIVGMAFFVFVFMYYLQRWAQEVHYFQGFKFSKSDRIPESIKSLETAYGWFPGEVNTNYELGNSYARYAKILGERGNVEEAKKYIEKAIWGFNEALRANPGYDEIYFNLGVTQFQNRQDENGIKSLRTAVLINPLLQNAYGSLSTHYVSQKNWTAARDILEQAVHAFPRERDYWNNLAYVYSQLGDDQKSYEVSKRAVQIDPTFKATWQNFQAIVRKLNITDPLLELPQLLPSLSDLVEQKKFAEAKPVAQKLVELLPDNLEVGLSYANILVYLGDETAAIKEYERLLSINPQFEAAHLNLGRVNILRKDFMQARIHLEKALKLNPRDEEAQKALLSLPSGNGH